MFGVNPLALLPVATVVTERVENCLVSSSHDKAEEANLHLRQASEGRQLWQLIQLR